MSIAEPTEWTVGTVRIRRSGESYVVDAKAPQALGTTDIFERFDTLDDATEFALKVSDFLTQWYAEVDRAWTEWLGLTPKVPA